MNRNFKVPKDESIQQASNPAPGRLRFKVPPSRPISSGAPTYIARRDNIVLTDNLRKLFGSDLEDDDDNNTKDERFDSLMKDADLNQQQIKRKNESYRRLMESQEYLSDDLLDDTKNDNDTASTASDRSASTNSGSYNKATMHINLSQLSHCPTCHHQTRRDTGLKRSDKALRNSIMDMTLKEILSNTCCGTNLSSNSLNAKKCKESGGRCIQKATMYDVYELRTNFWGDASFDDIITTKVRGKKLKELMSSFYDASRKQFNYKLGNTPVCERGFLLLLGLISGKKNPGSQFDRIKKEVMGLKLTKIMDSELRAKQDSRTSISNHAKNYIIYMASLNADSCPTDGKKLILPYSTLKEFYLEYVAFCTGENLSVNTYAMRETFRLAWKSLETNYKLIGAKGSFPTCDICNNANDLLRDTRIKDQSHREIIFKFKRLHLFQQMEERQYLERNRMTARNSYYLGQPTQAFFLIDAMTHARGNTPQVGAKFNQSKNETSAVISNRVIGCEVVCGPVDEIFYYNTDNLVSSGANIMCQVVLAVIEDLSRRLARYGKMLPRILFAQFDNCGENKNKYMFGMFSHLIEEHFFDEIHCNFLLVGHTHCSIDQNFGVLTEKINDQHFIGSPLSFQHLLDIAHKDSARRPTVNRQITVVYDFVKYFTPSLNPDIHFIRIPHCFKFSRLMNKAIMRYKMFSTHKTWLPESPSNSILNSENDLQAYLVTDVDIQKYVTIGGENVLNADLGLDGINIAEVLENPTLSTLYNDLKKVTPELRELELNSIDQQQQRMTFEEEHGGTKNIKVDFRANAKAKQIIENVMKNTSKEKRGYMVWLKAKVDLEDRQPEPVISLTDIENLLKNYSDESDNEIVDVEQNHRKTKVKRKAIETLQSNIKVIVQTARSVNNNLNRTHLYRLTTSGDFCYTHKELTQEEAFFYLERDSVEKVLNLYLEILQSLPAHFEWLRTDMLSEESLKLIESKKLETQHELDKLVKLAKSLLMKQHHDKEDGEHVMTGITASAIPKAKKAKVSSSRNNVCSINECKEPATTTCDYDLAVNTETGRIFKCKEDGISFCNLHGPKHIQHEHQVFKQIIEFEAERAAVAVQKAKERKEKSKTKQVEERIKQKSHIDALIRHSAVDISARSERTQKNSENRDRIIARNNQILERVSAIMHISENDDVVHSPDAPSRVEDTVVNNNSEIPCHIDTVEGEKNDTNDESIIPPTENQLIISPHVFNTSSNSRKRKLMQAPEISVAMSDRRYNRLAHRCMSNVFNGKYEPETCFMDTFNHNQYKNWLPDLVSMYDIPLKTIKPVFECGDNDFTDIDGCVGLIREQLKQPKTRKAFLMIVYKYLTEIYPCD